MNVKKIRKEEGKTFKATLWALFIAGQVLNTGNMHYQQNHGIRELNPIYGSHPRSEKIYAIKAVETVGIYLLSEHIFPDYDLEILGSSCGIVWGCIITDSTFGVKMRVDWH